MGSPSGLVQYVSYRAQLQLRKSRLWPLYVRIAPSAQALASTVSSASVILDEMSRRSPQDPFDNAGETIDEVQGNIEICGVSLVYPSRPGVQVMQKFLSLAQPRGRPLSSAHREAAKAA